MEVAITKISQNGQVVIPSEVRKDAGILPSTKFIVFNKGGNIMLKRLDKDALKKDIELIAKLDRIEKEIKKGQFTELDSSMSAEDMDNIIMK